MTGMAMSVVVLQGTVTRTNTTAKALFTLPAGAIPLLATVQVETAFNDSGTDLLTIGEGSDGDHFASGIDVSSTGAKLIAINESGVLTKQTQVTATYTGQNGNSTTGRAKINMIYATPFDPS